MRKRAQGTRGFHDRLAVVFDFDDTLAHPTVPFVLERLGVKDPVKWERDHCAPLQKAGWDQILSQGPLLLDAAKEHGKTVTKAFLEQCGRELPIFDGVGDTLPALREIGKQASEGATVELYVVSSGFVEIMGNSQVAKCFDQLLGSGLDFDDEGRLRGVKRAIIHSEKARYLLALAKGLDLNGADEPEDVFKDKPSEEWHLPLDQMIYVGDGLSDIDAFRLMHENGGIAIGVQNPHDKKQWAAAEHMFEQARVDNLAVADFREGTELHRSLVLAVECVGKRVALRRLARRD